MRDIETILHSLQGKGKKGKAQPPTVEFREVLGLSARSTECEVATKIAWGEPGCQIAGVERRRKT